MTDEFSYQIDVIIDRPRAQTVLKEIGISEAEFRNLEGSFISIKVIVKSQNCGK
jgi:hypothetical protein